MNRTVKIIGKALVLWAGVGVAGQSRAAQEPPEPFHGRSFAPLLRGESMEPPREFAVTARFLRAEPGAKPTKWVTPVLYAEEWAYAPIGAGGERELYEIRKDPYAKNDVAREHPDVTNELHAKFLDWLRKMEAPAEAIAPFE